MEQMGNILNNLNLHTNGKRTDGVTPLDSSRREIIRRQLMAFYLGCRREVSSPELLEMEIDLAMRDWEEIPTSQIDSVCTEAVKAAGEFMPANGLIAKVWREKDGDKKEAALKAIRAENTAKYLSPPSEDVPTEEQRAQIAAEFAKLSDLLKK